MKRIFSVLLTLISMSVFAQENLTELAKPIVEEGKRLYRSEMASWYGTDVFLEHYKDKTNIGGYFSYADNDLTKCIFFSNADKPKVIGTISFDSTYSAETAKLELREREFTSTETTFYLIRKTALSAISSDTIFKTYKNTNLNLIPLIYGEEKKVYVLTGTQEHGVVIFGNDYLISFDLNNNLVSTKQLHRNIIPINYANAQKDGKEVEGAVHTHLPETGDFITATDICTLMLYEKLAKWKQHNVVSKNYLNIWNCETNQLIVVPMSTLGRINNNQGKKQDNHSQPSPKFDSTMNFINDHGIKLNTVAPPAGFNVYYNCDSLLFMKGLFGDTIKIWTPGTDAYQDLADFKDIIKNKSFGETQFVKSIDDAGRIFVSSYHQTTFIYRNDSLFEIENSNPTASAPLTKLFTEYLGEKIDKQTFESRLDSLHQIEERQAVYTPKLIFAKKMFQKSNKVKLSKKLNFQGDTIELERQWTENGKTCYLVRINNKEDSEETSYAYAINQDMKFVFWEGCNTH